MTRYSLLLAALSGALLSISASAQSDYVNFESGLVRPLALSADGDTLFAVNAPDGRLEIFDVTGAMPVLTTSVPVGLEPVAVAVQDETHVWVVNHLSDSVSIVELSAVPRVIRTLWVGDEPRDVVFAGPGRRRAFVTTAHRGQNTPDPRGAYDVPGTGRADVWVFDSADLGDATGGEPLTVVNLFGDVPRALAVSPDGESVYAAVFMSGNGTTTINESAVCDGGAEAEPCGDAPGGLPAPNRNQEGQYGPEVGLIVRDRGDGFQDELGRDWSDLVRFDLPDNDVFEIDAMAAEPSATRSWSRVGTVNFAMAVDPSGAVLVANTEAINEVRFEGPGTLVRSMGLREGQPASVRSHLHEARITVLDGDSVTSHHLNPHLEYEAETVPADVRWRTLSTPVGLAMDAAGETLYVAALGSSSIGVLNIAELKAGSISTELDRSIPLRDPWPGGPMGLVLDEANNRLFVSARFDNSISVVDLGTREERGRVAMHTPEPEAVIVGRPILYDALATSSHGEASCGSCHVFGDLDGLAWDLGNPDGMVMSNPNPRGPVGGGQAFHPMKGPMTTQSFRGMDHHGPLHWRGDRTGGYEGDAMDEVAGFVAFNEAFEGLLGRREGPLTDEEMTRFAEFALTITYPPNPIRQLDNSLREDEARASEFYNTVTVDTVATCNGCHEHDRAQGFFGANGESTFENETQHFKVAHLRNLYQKVGMFGMAESDFFSDRAIGNEHMGPQVRGFGFLHDGSTDTVLRFFHASVFNGFRSIEQRADMEALMMAFDSDLPPIVGQQVTGTMADTSFLPRAQLLIDRAQAPMRWPGGDMTTECDLVVRGVQDGEMRGWLMRPGETFASDRAAEAAVTPEALLGLIDGPITLTCVPPGSGARMAYDRDSDGIRDGDERDAGSDPAARAPIAIPNLPAPQPEPPVGEDAGPGGDAGMMDASTSDGGMDAAAGDAGPGAGDNDGCGCRVGSQRNAPTPALLLLVAMLWRRSSRRNQRG